jgi:hypothetical protein
MDKGGDMFLRNGGLSPYYTALQPVRLYSSLSPPAEPHNEHTYIVTKC